ncbi:hypothetical protein Aperf_G00000053070 [Anoplocephala perfoliata]
MAMAPVLGYWDIRGLAEMCRLLLRYCGVEFEEKLYVSGPAPEFDRSDWNSKKYTLGLDFPNVPYYIDGDFKLTQSAAILEYIADSHDMIPTCKKSRAVLHMINDDINDFRNSFGQIVYNPDFKNLLVKFKETLPQQFRKYEQYLGDNKWLTGEKINYPDFNLCELLNQLVKLDSTCLDGHSKLKAYLHRFENLPALKDYMASEYFKNHACNNKHAQWIGGK